MRSYLANKMKARRAANPYEDEERVGLMMVDVSGGPGGVASGAKQRRPKQPQTPLSSSGKSTRSKNSTTNKLSQQQSNNPPWTFSRLMRMLSLTAVTAMVTTVLLRKESKVVHWEEYHHLLQPEGSKELAKRCYVQERGEKGERCSCPDPALPLPGANPQWKAKHASMVQEAKNAPPNLDIVFLGDDLIDMWTTTGAEMKDVFDSRFNKQRGGTLQGITLGSSGDTGPNMLWHIQNGLIDPLNPKVWVLLIGSNDLYNSKCTDHFVVANILNVLKELWVKKPGAQFIIHGVMPRKDKEQSKSKYLGKDWNRAQTVNTEIKKFTKHSSNLHFVQAGYLFTLPAKARGRRQIDETLLQGFHPTHKGMQVWSDYILKKSKEIIADVAERDAVVEKQS